MKRIYNTFESFYFDRTHSVKITLKVTHTIIII
jgi:hypothetical protein